MSMSSSSLLLRNGTVLYHNKDETITSLRNTDILIVDNKIDKIGTNLTAPPNTEALDCTDKIISPGFVDTHHHLWQTQMKGRHADHTLFDYMPTGNLQSYNYTPNDVFWGQLAGCLESIDAGTTFVLDHMHAVVTKEHVSAALAATTTSHLRSNFAYSNTYRFDKWDQNAIVPNRELFAEWNIAQLEDLARNQPYGDGRVNIGFGFDLWFLPKEMVLGIFERVLKAGVKVVTTHIQKNPLFSSSLDSSKIKLLDTYGLYNKIPHLVFSHGNGYSTEEYATMKSHSVYVSSTPSSECQMSMGWPVALRPDTLGSIGIDCHTNNNSSILSEARLLLQMARQETNLEVIAQWNHPNNLRGDTTKAFNLATIDGAKAVGMSDRIGSIAEGKLADLVIFDATSPAMICAVEWDPVVAVLRHSDIRDIDTVIIDGKICKRDGKLVDVDVELPSGGGGGGVGGDGEQSAAARQEKKNKKKLSWGEIAKELVNSRTEVQKRIDRCGIQPARDMYSQMVGCDPSKFPHIN